MIILLIGGSKKSQSSDLEKAVEYLKDFKARAHKDGNSKTRFHQCSSRYERL